LSRTLRIGTRGSDLALWQAEHVAGLLRARTGATCESVVVRTRGDVDHARALWDVDGTGFFTRELQEALLAGAVDLVVHSLKDLPLEEPDGLVVSATLQRDDPRELLLVRPGAVGEGGLGLRAGAVLGTSSMRRAGFALAAQPGLQVKPLRGNVPTRVRRLREGRYDAILVAAAGVDRLGLDLSGLVARRCEIAEILPAPGQGALAVEVRAGAGAVAEAVATLHEPGVGEATACERAVLKGLGGGCRLPIGAFARRCDDGLDLQAGLARLDPAMTEATVRRARVVGADWRRVAEAALTQLGEASP
jgi:hydroxymethylbilane synthase